MAAAAILDFRKFEILTLDMLYGANLRHRDKFHRNRSNSCGDQIKSNLFAQNTSHLNAASGKSS